MRKLALSLLSWTTLLSPAAASPLLLSELISSGDPLHVGTAAFSYFRWEAPPSPIGSIPANQISVAPVLGTDQVGLRFGSLTTPPGQVSVTRISYAVEPLGSGSLTHFTQQQNTVLRGGTLGLPAVNAGATTFFEIRAAAGSSTLASDFTDVVGRSGSIERGIALPGLGIADVTFTVHASGGDLGPVQGPFTDATLTQTFTIGGGGGAVIPEPASLLLLTTGAGILGIAGVLRRRGKASYSVVPQGRSSSP